MPAPPVRHASSPGWTARGAGALLAAGALALGSACRSVEREVVLFYPPRVAALDGDALAAPPADAPRVRVAPVRERRPRPAVVGVVRGPASMVTGRILALNDGTTWAAEAACFELERLGLRALAPGEEADRPPVLRLELELLETEAAADEEHPAQVVVTARLRHEGRMLFARRLEGSAAFRDADGVRIDPAESLALALRAALRPVAELAAGAVPATPPPPPAPSAG